jgi:hypothetical protein
MRDTVNNKVANDIDTHTIRVTFFKNFAASRQDTADLTMAELCDRILATVRPTKDKLPWLKLAIFGTKRTANNCLRHDANVKNISGAELDYDGEKVSFDAGLEMVRAMGIKALIYTSPRHTAAKPRWRVLAPTSKPCPPELRAKLVARMNGFMGGILEKHTESFTLSQSYYYGRVEENQDADHQAIVIDGDSIDLRDDLYKYQTKGEIREEKDANPFEAMADEHPSMDSRGFKDILAELGDGEGHRGFNEVLIRAVASYVAVYRDAVDRVKLKELLRKAINQAPKGPNRNPDDIPRYLGDRYLDGIIASAVKKFVELTEGFDLKTDFVAYMELHNYICIPTTGSWPAASINAMFPPVALLEADGSPKLIKKKVVKVQPSVWLDKNRAAAQITWAPGEPREIRDKLISNGEWIKKKGVMCLNLYKPPTIVHGDAAAVDPWLDHIRRIYPDDHQHTIDWLAHRVQKPGEKINHALLLGGAQGIGKDTILEPVKFAVGSGNFREVSPTVMLGRFNGFLKSVILRINEVRDLGEVNRYAFYEHLKPITAAPPDVSRVDEKNLKDYDIQNVCGVILTTNHKLDGIYLPADDRRTYVAWSKSVKEDFTDDYWDQLWSWYEADGFRNVAAYLAQRDLSKFNPKKPPPKTAAFLAIVNSNRAPEEGQLAAALDALENPDAVTLGQLEAVATADFYDWITDRKNRRAVPHKLESCGYEAVQNPDNKQGLWTVAVGITKDRDKPGRWRIENDRVAIYVKIDLAMDAQITAARTLVKLAGSEQQKAMDRQGPNPGSGKTK